MLHEALRRADGPVAFARGVHLLACEFTVRTSSAELDRRLEGAVPHAVQEYVPVSRHVWSASEVPSGFLLDFGAGETRAAESAADAVDALVARMHERAFAEFSGQTKIHAGCADFGDRRLLVVGQGRAGKTTLMTRLLYEGVAVQGDEMVIVRAGRVVAYPRRFGVRQATLALIPQITGLTPAWAREPAPGNFQVVSFDPTEAGLRWRIREAPVDDIVLLRRDAGAASSIEPCDRHAMARFIMANSTSPSGDPRLWVRDVCAILPPARCYTLTMGDLDAAIGVLCRTLEWPHAEKTPRRSRLDAEPT